MNPEVTTITVHIERLPHRHAVIRLRQAYRQLSLVPLLSPIETTAQPDVKASYSPTIQEISQCKP